MVHSRTHLGLCGWIFRSQSDVFVVGEAHRFGVLGISLSAKTTTDRPPATHTISAPRFLIGESVVHFTDVQRGDGEGGIDGTLLRHA